MGDTRKIICPSCSTVLTVGYFDGIEAKSFPCPKCHNVHKYTDYRPFAPRVQGDDETDLRNVVHQKGFQGASNGSFASAGDDTTSFEDLRGTLIGRIQIPGGEPVQLKKGRNVIGRKASSSKADIQIPDSTNTMSREHFYIDVIIQNGKVVHILSVCPTAKNPTLLNDTIVGNTDKMILRDGYRISAGRIRLIFGIPE